jgi:hypothetical protein
MRGYLKVISLVGIFSFSSCSKIAPSIIYGGSGVYVAGVATDPKTSSSVTTYWKDGVAISLTSGSYYVGASSIFVSGQDVYVAGTDKNLEAKYWKNEVPTTLTNLGEANSIIVSGSDVYVAGTSYNADNIALATYWKNGKAFYLSDGSKDEYANSIFVSGSDVYVAGQENDLYSVLFNNGKTVAASKYWKNGVPYNLSDGTRYATANSITVSGSDVYVAGWENNVEITSPALANVFSVAKYWKNGIPVNLTDGTSNAKANSIIVSGGDIYVAGYENNNAKYWKDGIAVALTDGTYIAGAYSINVAGLDVYVAGNENNVAKYWKNGVAVTLVNGTWARSVFIVP